MFQKYFCMPFLFTHTHTRTRTLTPPWDNTYDRVFTYWWWCADLNSTVHDLLFMLFALYLLLCCQIFSYIFECAYRVCKEKKYFSRVWISIWRQKKWNTPKYTSGNHTCIENERESGVERRLLSCEKKLETIQKNLSYYIQKLKFWEAGNIFSRPVTNFLDDICKLSFWFK